MPNAAVNAVSMRVTRATSAGRSAMPHAIHTSAPTIQLQRSTYSNGTPTIRAMESQATITLVTAIEHATWPARSRRLQATAHATASNTSAKGNANDGGTTPPVNFDTRWWLVIHGA